MVKHKTRMRLKAEEDRRKKRKNKRNAFPEVGNASQESLSSAGINNQFIDPTQVSQLSDKRFSLGQRQNMAIHLGKLIGNRNIQRMGIATGAAPNAGWQVVPRVHRGRVRAALALINDWVANNPRLSTYFRHNAPGGTNATLQTVAARAQVWEMVNEGNLGESYAGGSDMAYDPYIFRIGRWQIASTLLHEMGHLASFATEAQCEDTLEAARAYCPFIESISPRQGRVGDEITITGMSFGPTQTADDKVEFNGVDAGMAVSWSWSHAGGEIKVCIPTGASTGPLCVVNNNIRSNEVNFSVLP
jgi:hypothetical protein